MKTKTLLCLAVIVLLLALIEARGGRGGGRGSGRGGGRSSRSRSGSRTSSRSRSRYSKFSGNRISSKRQLRTVILSGTVYGARRWKSQNSHWTKGELPEVCYNDKYNMTQDGNSTYLGRFLCPTDRSMRGDKSYCCGRKGTQYCCTFWEDGGRVAGVVIGLLLLVGIVSITVYCCIKRGDRYRRSKSFFRTPPKDHYQMPPDDQDQNTPLRTNHQDSKPVPKIGSSTGDALYAAPQNDLLPSCAPPSYELACHAPGDLPYDPNPSIEKPLGPSNGFLPYSTAPPLSRLQYGNTPYSTGNPPNSSGNLTYSAMPYPPNKAPIP